MGKNNKKSGADSNKPSTTDSRFAGASHDPRFRIPKSKNLKIKLDDRFTKSDFTNKKEVEIDKYGRNLKDLDLDDKNKDFDRYYKEAGEDESEEEEEENNEDSGEEEENSEDSEEEEEGAANSVIDRARGEGVSSESSSDSDSDSDSDDSANELVSEGEELVIEENEPETGDPTRRLALVNMDWDNVRAVDLMATFSGFAKGQGHIRSITIYPSEYGKEKMAKEELEGPARELFANNKKSKEKAADDDDEDSDSDSDVDLNNKYDADGNREKAIKELYEEDEGVEYDSKNLRKYQLQRLRYYYAIIDCEDVATAKKIYDNCDGLEFEATANFFDLRYVPDDTEFDDDDQKDFCDRVPVNYKPKIDFQTSALQHSKVKLTWDETPTERLEMATKAFSNRDIEDMDFKAYLATDSEDSGDEGKEASSAKKNKLKELLQNTKIGDKNLFESKGDGSDSEVDMQITFTPGLDGKNHQEEEEDKDEIEESTIDKYKRRAKERRKARKEQVKQEKKKQSGGTLESDSEDEEPKKSKKKTHNKKDDKEKLAEQSKSKAELELLMMDEENAQDDKQHFDLKHIMKSEKNKGKKKKNKSKNVDDEFLQDDFKADLEDDRFKEIFENQDYAIDPNQPEFKKTSTMMKILEERNKRVTVDDDEDEDADGKKKSKSNKRKHKQDNGDDNNNNSASSLAQKIKNKYKKSKKNKK